MSRYTPLDNNRTDLASFAAWFQSLSSSSVAFEKLGSSARCMHANARGAQRGRSRCF